MKFRILPFLLLSAVAARGETPPSPPAPGYSREAYASLGSGFAQNIRLAELGWTEAQFEAFVDGLRATFHGHPNALSPEAARLQAEVGRRVEELVNGRHPSAFADPARVQAYMKQRAQEMKLKVSDTGLAYGLMVQNGVSRPGPEDKVIISFQAIAADGQTALPGLAADHLRLDVSDLLPGLAEAVQMMTPGGSAILIVPPELSFGDGDWPAGVERGSPIIFTLTLHEIVAAP